MFEKLKPKSEKRVIRFETGSFWIHKIILSVEIVVTILVYDIDELF